MKNDYMNVVNKLPEEYKQKLSELKKLEDGYAID